MPQKEETEDKTKVVSGLKTISSCLYGGSMGVCFTEHPLFCQCVSDPALTILRQEKSDSLKQETKSV